MSVRTIYKVGSFIFLSSSIFLVFITIESVAVNSRSGSSEVREISEDNMYESIYHYKRALNQLSMSQEKDVPREFKKLCDDELEKVNDLIYKLENDQIQDKELKFILFESSEILLNHPAMRRYDIEKTTTSSYNGGI